MNNKKQKKEYVSDREVEKLLKRDSLDIKPSKESLHALLHKIPDSIPSPYTPTRSHFFNFQKTVAIAFVSILFLSGGGLYINHKVGQSKQVVNTTQTKPNSITTIDDSDQSISNDLSNIDSQMMGLDADNQSID